MVLVRRLVNLLVQGHILRLLLALHLQGVAHRLRMMILVGGHATEQHVRAHLDFFGRVTLQSETAHFALASFV